MRFAELIDAFRRYENTRLEAAMYHGDNRRILQERADNQLIDLEKAFDDYIDERIQLATGTRP